MKTHLAYMDNQNYHLEQFIKFFQHTQTHKQKIKQNIVQLKQKIPALKQQVIQARQIRARKVSQLIDFQNNIAITLSSLQEDNKLIYDQNISLNEKLQRIQELARRNNQNNEIIRKIQQQLYLIQCNSQKSTIQAKCQKFKQLNPLLKIQIAEKRSKIEKLLILKGQLQNVDQLKKCKQDYLRYFKEMITIKEAKHNENQSCFNQSIIYIKDKIGKDIGKLSQRIRQKTTIIKDKINNNVAKRDLKMLLKVANINIELQNDDQKGIYYEIYERQISTQNFGLINPYKRIEPAEIQRDLGVLNVKIQEIKSILSTQITEQKVKDEEIENLSKTFQNLMKKISSLS